VTDPGHFKDRELVVHGLANRGEWFGETWIVIVSIANALHAAIVVEGEHEQAVIDYLADSDRWSHLIDLDECKICDSSDPYCECEDASYAGNDSHRVDLDYVTMLSRCKVHYFEPADRRFLINNSRVYRPV
jgi:hypothetical protein